MVADFGFKLWPWLQERLSSFYSQCLSGLNNIYIYIYIYIGSLQVDFRDFRDFRDFYIYIYIYMIYIFQINGQIFIKLIANLPSLVTENSRFDTCALHKSSDQLTGCPSS